MKKLILTFIFALFSIGFVFAQESENVENSNLENKIALDYANYLFSDGFLKGDNAEKIAELASFLTAEQRENLYSENEKTGVKPFLLNLLLGFGIGSFNQGDKLIGHLQLWGDIAGYTMMIAGMRMILKASDDLETSPKGTALMAIGSLVTLGVGIPAYIRPWIFAANRNEKLRSTLQVDENGKAVSLERTKLDSEPSVSFVPIIQPVSNEYGLMAKISF